MPEIVYFEDASARISNTWFVFSNRVYRTEDIDAVTTRAVSTRNGFWRVYISLLGLPFLLIWWFLHGENLPYLILGYILTPLVALIFAYTLFMDLTKPRDNVFLIVLHRASGSSTACASLELGQTEAIVAAIKEALDNKASAIDTPAPISNELPPISRSSDMARIPHLVGGVFQLTPAEIKINNHFIDLSTIKSIKWWPVPIERIDEILFLVGAIGWFIWVVFGFPIWVPIGSTDPNHPITFLLASIGILLYILMNFIRPMRAPIQVHLIELRGTFGRVNTFASIDENLVKSFVERANKVRKGKTPGMKTSSGAPS